MVMLISVTFIGMAGRLGVAGAGKTQTNRNAAFAVPLSRNRGDAGIMVNRSWGGNGRTVRMGRRYSTQDAKGGGRRQNRDAAEGRPVLTVSAASEAQSAGEVLAKVAAVGIAFRHPTCDCRVGEEDRCARQAASNRRGVYYR